MEEERTEAASNQGNENVLQVISREKAPLTPFTVRRGELIGDYQRLKRISLESLRNKLNHIHFTDQHVLIHLHDPKYNENLLLKAHVEPCLGSELTCHWSDEASTGLVVEDYEFLHLIIDDGQSMMLIPARLISANTTKVTLGLPEVSYAVGQRRTKRHTCRHVEVELIQNGFSARGRLLNFSPMGFSVKVRPDSSSSFHWFNPDSLTTIQLRSKQQVLFSGRCRCLRQAGLLREREIVLAPEILSPRSSSGSKIRNPRQHLVPAPRLLFEHPLIDKKVQLQVSDISTSGFSVYEKANEAVLLPGMIIPALDIAFAGGMRMRCTAQVVYQREEVEGVMSAGLALLDMDMNSYTRLSDMLANAQDPHTHISSEVDMDALWEFFFDSGFIYPKKYGLIQSRREEFKETYQRVYRAKPDIARHFVYEQNSRILGHFSMARAYDRAWMIHHHAARDFKSCRGAGFKVLKQVMYHMNAVYRLASSNMDYNFGYFRPENKFPRRIFGGFAESLNNPRGCSMDLFSYMPYTTLSLGTNLPDRWSLQECSNLDLWELSRFYNHHSGGLLVDMLSLGHRNAIEKSLEDEFKQAGFVRSWKAYSLTHAGQLKAVLIVNRSDMGVNLSELLNCIKVLVTDSKGLPWEILSAAINQLTGIYEAEKVPILVYPSEYLEGRNTPRETKRYYLWIYDVRLIGKLMEYVQKKFRISWE